MFSCPHCGQPIDIGPASKMAWWRYEPKGPVSLGCGTLILIAIIVSIFSRGGNESEAIRALQNDIKTLEMKIDNIPDRPRTVEPLTAEKGDE